MESPSLLAVYLVPPAVQQSLDVLLAFLAEPIQNLPDDLTASREVLRSWLTVIRRESPAFPTGFLCATPGVAMRVEANDMIAAFARHTSGDWGEVDAEDWLSNDQSLKDGTRLLSAYSSEGGVRFWIITEADRSATTFLLPEEY